MADLVILLIFLLPSETIFFIWAKSESIKTTFEASLAASLPVPIAIEQSASFIAKISLTPSPVIATFKLSDFKLLIICFFCSGLTLPKTVYFLTTSSISESKIIVFISIYFSAFLIPAAIATLDTVIGLSPEITLTSTPCSSKYEKISLAFFLILLTKTVNNNGTFSPSTSLQNTNTLFPSFMYEFITSSLFL